jgi:LPXTG-site transpeptidase (sortase) family protein
MKQLTPRSLAIFGSLTCIIGLIIVLASFVSTPTLISADQEVVESQPVPVPTVDVKPATEVSTPVSGRAVRIQVPSVGIDLAVIDGYYDYTSHEWTLTKTKAQFATPSELPNNTSGTTFIYGHDINAVFHKLHKIAAGQQANVVTANGYRFVYTFRDSVVTSPMAINEVTAQSTKPQLSLLTCYGPTSADRRIFYFDFASVEKI